MSFLTQQVALNREAYFFFPVNKDYDSIENDAFKFKDDRWDFSALIENPSNYSDSHKYVDFSPLPNTFKENFKRFVYHKLSSSKPQTAAHSFNKIKYDFIRFVDEYDLSSFSQFDTQMFMGFNAWLRQTYITEPKANGEKERRDNTLYPKALFLKQLLDTLMLYGWGDIPSEQIDLGDTTLIEMWGQTKRQKEKRQNEIAEARLIPRPVWDTIIEAAQAEGEFSFQKSKKGDLNQVVYRSGHAKGIKAVNFVKYLILTLAWTGLRVSEAMSLKSSCAFIDRWDKCWLRRTSTKTVDEPTEGDIRIPRELYDTLLDLKRLTKEYRIRSGMDRLFFTVVTNQDNRITPFSKGALSTTLPNFRKRNPIYGDDGELFHYTSHDFRHTFASILVNDLNVSLTTMLRHYSHLSLEMTMHYTHLSKETIKKRALKGFINTDKIFFNGNEGKLFVKKMNEAKAEKDFDAALSKLSDAFGINSLPIGLCLYDYRRGHCPNLGVQSCWEIGCSSFVTSDDFLMNFEHERDTLEMQIERDNRLGQLASAKMKRIKYGKIVRIIGELSA